MGLVLVVLLAALAVGLLRHGSVDGLARLDLRRRRLVVAAVVVQLAGSLAGGAAYAVGLILSVVLVGVFLAANRGLRGLGLVTLGLLANALVVCANGAMPVSLDAATRAGLSGSDLALLSDPRHEPTTPDTHLRVLADVVPLPLPLAPEVVSPGDVLVAAGLAELVVLAMGSSRPVHVRSRTSRGTAGAGAPARRAR